MRPLAVQDESLAPGGGSIAKSRGETLHAVRHHLALQAVRRACTSSSAPQGSPEPGPDPGPDRGRAAARDALAGLCASAVAPAPPVAAYGSLSTAHRRWVEDRVRELPESSETAAAAAGG